MKKSEKDSILKQELKGWGAALCQFGREWEDGLKEFGTEILTGKPPKKTSGSVFYVYDSRRARERRK